VWWWNEVRGTWHVVRGEPKSCEWWVVGGEFRTKNVGRAEDLGGERWLENSDSRRR